MENGSRKGTKKKKTISKTLKGKMRAIEQQSAAIFPFDKISIGFVSTCVVDDLRLKEKYRDIGRLCACVREPRMVGLRVGDNHRILFCQ